jgi:methionyl-tRNA formyltransferase
MKVVYFGTPQFAAHVLEDLLKHGVEVVAVISRTDKPKGRSGDPVPTPVKEVAIKHQLPIYQPEKVSSEEFRPTLESFNADLFIVVAYGEILKQHVLDAPKIGCINVHASLLPKYRGAAPIQQAIINGEKESGISIMYMVKKMDAGDVITTAVVPISDEMTFGELETALCQAGCKSLQTALQFFKDGKVPRAAQDESQVTFAPKIELEDCEIDWNKPAQQIHNLVKGVNPYPGAWTRVVVKGQEKRLKIFATRVINSSGKPGACSFTKGEMTICCGSDALVLKEVQLEGKKRMSGEELFRGIPLDQFALVLPS